MKSTYALAGSLAGAVALCDQALKQIVTAKLEPGHTWKLVPRLLTIEHLHNPAAAYGAFAGASGSSRLFVLLLVPAVIALLWAAAFAAARTDNRRYAAACGLIVGGALGNLLDRAFRGFVVDFLRPHWGHSRFAVYNVADLCIFVGGVMLVRMAYEARRQDRRSSVGAGT